MANKKSSSTNITEENSMQETDVSKEFINFFVNELKAIYWVEKHLVKAIPKMQKAATAAGLKDAFSGHLASTHLQEERLEHIFDLLGENPRAKKCEAMADLVEEANDVIEETGKGTVIRDAGLVLTAQKIEHYEIATYSALLQFAKTMGNEDIISLLEETLSEEKDAAELLTVLSERGSNDSAAGVEKQQENIEKISAIYDSVNLTGKNTRKA
jgi:ferritin-like metal-binding protein YciE